MNIPGKASLLALLTRVFIATIGATSSVSVARIGGEGGEALAGPLVAVVELVIFVRGRDPSRASFLYRSHSVCGKVLLSVDIIANDGETDSSVLFQLCKSSCNEAPGSGPVLLLLFKMTPAHPVPL